jgi:hypothetical protein
MKLETDGVGGERWDISQQKSESLLINAALGVPPVTQPVQAPGQPAGHPPVRARAGHVKRLELAAAF